MADFFKFLRSSSRSSDQLSTAPEGERSTRRCIGLGEFVKALSWLDGQKVLDLGPTSPANISFFTNMGQRAYMEDLLTCARDPELQIQAEDGSKSVDVDRFLAENLNFEPGTFDAVLLWDVADYLSESLVKPVVQRIHKITKPGALILAFFHTKDAGPDAAYQRYHIVSPDMIEMQLLMSRPGREQSNRHEHFKLQRVFNNRHIENLFRDFGSLKFFLGRDNIREVLIVR